MQRNFFLIDIIAGARPNFMKIAPIINALHHHNTKNSNIMNYRLVHTGQHYDKKMSESFFEQLNIPTPNINLGAGGGTAAEQTAQIMIGYERYIETERPDLCLVVGDVTSTLACTIVAKKAGIRVAHVEAGIRSGDMTMPEEINRIVTDSISDIFFTTSKSAGENLINMGKNESQIVLVGNTMIDTLLSNLDRIYEPDFFKKLNLSSKSYLIMTLHRPSNVDDPQNLKNLLSVINDNSGNKKIIFPIHPRTKKLFNIIDRNFENILITEPLPYLEFIYCIKNSAGVITDSGGITEEATVLGIPCMTLRNNTERPETVDMGTNELVGTDLEDIQRYLLKMVSGNWKKGKIPELWDGKSAIRIINNLSIMSIN